MNKLKTVIWHEYWSTIRTKAFLAALVLIPTLMAISVAVPLLSERYGGPSARKCAVVDGTEGQLFQALEAAALRAEDDSVGERSLRGNNVFAREQPRAGETAAALGLRLSEAVKSGALFCFLEIPSDVFELELASVRYYTNTPTDVSLPNWLADTLQAEIERVRLMRLGLDPDAVRRAQTPVKVVSSELYGRAEDGHVAAQRERDPLRDIAFPLAASLMMFMVVMLAAGPLMQSVLEEKMHRIAEILISSIPPFQLMLGKLIAASLVSLTLLGSYAIGGVVLAHELGVTSAFGFYHWFWIVIFQGLALAMYGSVFLAVGSACNDLKESQTLMMPVMVVVTTPLLLLHIVLSDPNGTLATVLSLVPFFSPFLLMLRVALEPGAPPWQVVLGALLTLGTATLCVYGAARVFRWGMLAQGSAPTLRELFRLARHD